MLFMTVKNNNDIYSDLLIVRDRRDCTRVFLPGRKNVTSSSFKQIKEMVLRDMHATPDSLAVRTVHAVHCANNAAFKRL